MSSDANRTDLEPSAENGALTMERLEEFRQSFDANPSNRLMQNAVTQHDVNDIALNRSIVTEANHTVQDCVFSDPSKVRSSLVGHFDQFPQFCGH